MPRFYLILSLFIIYNDYVCAQTVRTRADFFSAGGYHEKFADAFSATVNPASLALCKSFTAGVYTERRFLLRSLKHFMMAAAIPVSGDGAGFQADHFAAPGYTQSTIGIGYAKKLGKANIGARFHYGRMVAAGYGKTGALAIEAGSNWSITDNIRLAMAVYAPAGHKKPAYRYRSGLGYIVSDQLLLVVEADREEDRPVNIHAGFCYRPASQWALQMGITTANAQPYLCTGLQWGHLRVWITVVYSFQLGPSQGLAILYVPHQSVIQ